MENITDFETKALLQETESVAAIAPVAAVTAAAPIAPSVAAPVAAGSVLRQALLGRLLLMAQRYRQEGNYRQATEMCWTLVYDHAESPEAATAQAELLALAEGYERAGNQHMARSMYEKLMDLED
jgi:hypothetical protein